LDKFVAWINTAAAAFMLIAAYGGASWEAAWFAATTAWFSWMVVLRA
jgi:hypothetical protein